MLKNTYRGALDVDELLRVVARLLRKQRQFDGLICRYLADLADGLGRWPGLLLAHGDVYQLARDRLGMSLRSSRERIRVGRALRELPELFSALMAGDVAYSRVREVTRVARPDTELQWLQAARELSMRRLERSVVAAGGGPGARAPAESKEVDRGGRFVRGLNLPRHVWLVLEEAMNGAKRLSPKPLTDAEALESVARAALAQQSWQQHCGRPDWAASPAPEATQSGSRAGASDEPSATAQSGLDGAAGEVSRRTQTGSWDGEASDARGSSLYGPTERDDWNRQMQSRTTDGEMVDAAPQTVSGQAGARPSDDGELSQRQRPALSSDAEQLMQLIRGDRTWNAATLCDETGIPVPRLITALTDLEMARRVYRDPMGFYEAAPTGPVREAS